MNGLGEAVVSLDIIDSSIMHGDPKSRSAEGDNDATGRELLSDYFAGADSDGTSQRCWMAMTTWEVLKSQGDASLLGMSESPWDGDCSRQTRLLPSAPDPGSPTPLAI